jgi:Phosphotransferase enzyme family
MPVDGLTAWAGDWFAGRGLEVREADVVRAMPWASVVCFELEGPSGAQIAWGKAMSPSMAVEIDLLPVLARAVPEGVLEPLAADRRRGFLLLPDGGPTVGDLHPDVALPAWRSALEGYARLQRSVTPYAEELLAAGATDLRPSAAADVVAELAARDDLHVLDGPHSLTPDEVRRLREVAIPGAQAVAAELASAEVPATIQHDDMSPSNALVQGLWLDWGDANVAHPFASLLTALDGTSGRPGGPSHVPALRAAYLAVWAELTGVRMDVLDREADLAMLLAPVGRILSWLRAGPAALELYPGAITRWLRRLADAPWPS